jgi:uncharacterized membrane protein
MIFETRTRTLSKSISYRILAIISSIIIVGWVSAFYVELSKTVIFYLCERGWMKISWGVQNEYETWTRSIVKSIFYRIIATVVVALWVGIESALWLALIQTLLFILNDRVWQSISWGRNTDLDKMQK